VFDGLICARDLDVEPRPEWAVRRVRDAMVPAQDIPVVAPDTPALDVLRLMQTSRADRIAVIREARLLGFVDVTSVDRYLRSRETRRRRPESRLTAA
jgi:CBS domain-containing protein